MALTIRHLMVLLTVFNTQLCIASSRQVRRSLDEESQHILNIHNSLRRKVGIQWENGDFYVSNMKKLKWDYDLAKQARDYAVCENIGREVSTDLSEFDHFYGDEVVQEPGRNTAFDSKTTIRELIETWFNQREYYSYEWQSCRPEKNCDGFLQLAWADADKIGCAVNRGCIHGGVMVTFLVCLYNVPATPFEPPFLLGEECSRCDSSAGFCESGLCVPNCVDTKGLPCGCKKSCRHPGIGEGILDKATCSCKCAYGRGDDCEEACENPAHYDDWDICAAMNTMEGCADTEWQREWCPANCDYGCRKAPTLEEQRPTKEYSGRLHIGQPI
ncbi:cysteine-rich venom protein VAR8-like [Ptychodera flava]|uniref:cysteine-rich venom protein VAR8-like n=1 Tax=Ptychodera flava TaxID=63121 RepID=UPI00396A9DA3